MWYVQVHVCVYRSTFGIQLYFLANVQRCRERVLPLGFFTTCRAAARTTRVGFCVFACAPVFCPVAPCMFPQPPPAPLRGSGALWRLLAVPLLQPHRGLPCCFGGRGLAVEILSAGSTTWTALRGYLKIWPLQSEKGLEILKWPGGFREGQEEFVKSCRL
jgi:hypothetical protein